MRSVYRQESETKCQFLAGLVGIAVTFEPHVIFKRRVPTAIGMIRTADTTPYSNMILEAAGSQRLSSPVGYILDCSTLSKVRIVGGMGCVVE